jgi:cellulose synthase/poly-beta-1,6-N-acetylglucosamine synthase-like glycosyltransferase
MAVTAEPNRGLETSAAQGADMDTARHSAVECPLLTVIVPVYNECRTVGELLRKVLAAPCDKEIIVVDDASTDGTSAILEEWKDCRMGLRMLEVPIGYRARSVREGKKIRYRDGIEALRTLWRWRHWKPDTAPKVGLPATERAVRM